MFKVKPTATTFIKKTTDQSSSLTDDQKKLYNVGDEISIDRVNQIKDGHCFCQLAYGQGEWYLFDKHFEPKPSSFLTQPSQLENAGYFGLEQELKRAVEFTATHEGMILVAYPDPLHGWDVPTIGMGTTIYPNGKKVRRGDRITREQAFEYAMDFLRTKLRPQLIKIPTWDKMSVNQRVALYSFGYNLGANFYKGRNFQSITNVCDSPDRWSDKDWIISQFIKYRNPGSNVEQGLKKRRIEEANYFII